MTPHNEAKIEDIAENVIMPGDPLRAKYIAENFLTDAKLINSVRNMFAYTGNYEGKRVTIFPSGMGMPSMGIYCYELFKFYNVQNIIRVGSCGANIQELELFDTVLVDKSYNMGNFSLALTGEDNHICPASEELNSVIKKTAAQSNIELVEGNSICSEVFDFYVDMKKYMSLFPKDLNLIVSEMEAYALFSTAKLLGKKAACLLSVVDSKFKKENATSDEREKSLNNMIEISLKTTLDL